MRLLRRNKSIPLRKAREQIEQESKEQVVAHIQGFVTVPHSGIRDPWATAERWSKELWECDWIRARIPSERGLYLWMLGQLLCGKLSPIEDGTGGWKHSDLRHHEFMEAWMTHRYAHEHCPEICQGCSNKNVSEAQPLCALNLNPCGHECDGYEAVLRSE